MIKIYPNVDAYGKYARVVALADILELQALRGPSASVAELADYIRDSSWARKVGSPFRNVPEESDFPVVDEEFEDLGEESDASDAAAREVFDTLSDREGLLGRHYPFRVEGERLIFKGGSVDQWAYLLFLVVTVAHAYRVEEADLDPRSAFEELVAAAFATKGFLVSPLGRLRKSMSLESALEKVGEDCHLRPTLSQAVIRKRAQEEGVDVVAHLEWNDSRPLHWVYVIQATCAMSDVWQKKLHETSAGLWGRILGLLIQPRVVLAIPHHLQRDTMHYLFQDSGSGRLIIDRIRLSVLDPANFAMSDRLFSLLLNLSVEFN